MSLTGGTASGAVSKQFFCYQCIRTVTLSVSRSSDPACPDCNDGFIEESENPNPNPIPNPDLPDPITLLFNLQSRHPRPVNQDPVTYDPVAFLQAHLADLRDSRPQIPFVVQNHPNRYGTPPASKPAVDSLPTVKVTEQVTGSEMNQCVVCMDEFERGTEVKQMPCSHIYHKDCILPWLEMHNSCPICRHELPTDDPDYEARAAVAARAGAREGSAGRGQNLGVLPRPFAGRGSDSRTSGGGGGAAGPHLD